MSTFQVNSQLTAYDNAISEIASNPDETELIKFHLENTIRLTGDIGADVRRAKVLANEGKFKQIISDLTETNKSKATLGNADSSSFKPGAKDEPPLTDRERAILQRKGLLEKYIKDWREGKFK